MREYYLKNNGRIKGPFMLDDLKHQDIKPTTLVKTEKDGQWIPIQEDGDLHFLVKIKSNYRITEHNERRHDSPGRPRSLLIILIMAFLLALGVAVFIFLGLQPQMN